MDLPDCRPPYHVFKPPACIPGTVTLVMLFIVVAGLLVAGIITTLAGFAAVGILIFSAGVVVVIGAASCFLIRCHAGAVQVKTQILAELHNINDTLGAQPNLASNRQDTLYVHRDTARQQPNLVPQHPPVNDDEIRRLHQMIRDLEYKYKHH